MVKDKDIVIRISQELKEQVQIKAKEIGLSVSSYIRVLLIEKIKEK
jgi:antitoxin component of RelBE/YafQ-DinJ toxin-antitoxin module